MVAASAYIQNEENNAVSMKTIYSVSRRAMVMMFCMALSQMRTVGCTWK